VNLQSNSCVEVLGTPIHEIMHAVGFMHEQNREERDGYVIIHNENIQNGLQRNFEKAKNGEATAFSVKYDYGRFDLSILQKIIFVINITLFCPVSCIIHHMLFLKTINQQSKQNRRQI
jgi:Astacin (Peptidase family M12A)